MSLRRACVYFVLSTLFVASVAANFLLYRQEQPYVTSRPVDAAQLYSPAQVGIARSYLDLESPMQLQQFTTDLDRELVLPALGSTLEKIEAVSTYLFSLVQPHEGMPAAAATLRSGLQVFDAMAKGNAMWSDGVARAYVTVANAAGVPSRLVHLTAPGGVDRWFAESYVGEQERWAFVDLRYRKLYVEDWSGEVVSAADLLSAVHRGDIDQYEVALFEGGSVVYRPYLEHAASERFFFQPNAALHYPRPKELRPSRLGVVRHYLHAPARVFALDWAPFIQWGWVKLSLLSITALLGTSLIVMILRERSA